MDPAVFFRSKTAHGLVLTAFVLMAVYDPVRDVVPAVNYVIAVGVILAWLLGTRYERELLIRLGAIEREAAIAAERDALSM